jgi:predicted Zn-dependent protease with MMP-like domain
VREIFGPPLKAAALAALVAGLLWLLLDPPSLSGFEGLVTIIGAALAFIVVTAWLVVLATGREMPEREFQRLVARSDALAAMPPPDRSPSEFDEIVAQALDDLPEEFRKLAEATPVIVSSGGREAGAYGLYVGATVARDGYPSRIVIYQDTLERDFGHDPDLLRAQVERTVRHELAHHLGWNESGVRGLGL